MPIILVPDPGDPTFDRTLYPDPQPVDSGEFTITENTLMTEVPGIVAAENKNVRVTLLYSGNYVRDVKTRLFDPCVFFVKVVNKHPRPCTIDIRPPDKASLLFDGERYYDTNEVDRLLEKIELVCRDAEDVLSFLQPFFEGRLF